MLFSWTLLEISEIFRDFVYIDDVIKCSIAAANSGKGIYNVCTGKSRSFQDIYDIISTMVDLPKVKYKPNPITKGYQSYTCGSVERIKDLINNFQPTTLEEGIESMINNYLL